MSIRLYNTLGRKIETFTPIESGRVRMYVCGMTIYDYCHIGHARMMVAFDVLQRWLKHSGYEVTYTRNITDIDDKIIKRALEKNISIGALTDEMITAMKQDFSTLNIEEPTYETRATQYIPQMLAIIDKLTSKALAYSSANGDVNFSVRKFSNYGKLSGKSIDDLRAGERVPVQSDKLDPLDFVLWKAAKADEPEDAKWDSQKFGFNFGVGRPGWHIECSAMSCATLGETFDIHGGGADLEFPHHENEIAQSEGAHGKPLANYWVHNGFLRVDGEKMSKSLGNFFTIREILEKYDAQTLRFFLLRAHYRSPLNYSNVHLDDAKNALTRLYTTLNSVLGDDAITIEIDWSNSYANRFQAALDEDLGTPEAVAILFELASEVNRSQSKEMAHLLRMLGGCLGVLQDAPSVYLKQGALLSDEEIERSIGERNQAKKDKNFILADEIRQSLLSKGVALKDSQNGTDWDVVRK